MLTLAACIMLSTGAVAHPLEQRRPHDAHWHQYAWRDWLPDKYRRVAQCETGIDWRWDSGTYVSAFGIFRPAYDEFSRRAGLLAWGSPGNRTPRDQFTVARAIHDRYGWGAWGCGGA